MRVKYHRAILVLLSALIILSAPACDRDGYVDVIPLDTGGQRLLHLRTITQLLPNRPTHVGIDRLGQIFWVQENEDAQDVLFIIPEGVVPRSTRMTSTAVVEAVESESGAAGDGQPSGNIRALAPAERGVFFYFYGFRGNAPRACIGQYLPQSGRIRILADTAALEQASGMGRSLQLARPTLVTAGDTVYLWLRHMDASVFLSFDPRTAGPFGQVQLRRPFEQVVADHRALPLARGDAELSPGPEGSLLLTDYTGGILYRVNGSGEATALFSLIGLPRQLAAPTFSSDERLLSFAADSPLIGTELEILTRRDLPKISFPALLEITPRELQFIPRDNIRAPAGFPAYAARLGRLFPEAAGTYITYDAASGALMRVRIEESR